MRLRILIPVALLVLVVGFIVLNRAMLAFLPNPWTRLAVMPLGGGAYWLKGGVSNTGFVVGDKGVIVIDPQMFQTTARTAIADIAKITPKPIQHIIVTHSDPDHINGLPAYPAGIDIIAQRETRLRMISQLADKKWMPFAPPRALKDHLPTQLVDHELDVILDGVPFDLIHVGPAHTDGDLIAYLPRQHLVYAGDILTPSVGSYPGLHLEKNGSSLGWIRFVEAMLKLDADTFISGHGAPMDAAQLRVRLKNAIQRRAVIVAMVDRGLDLKQIKAALHDPKPTGDGAFFPTFTETTYRELGGK